MLLLPLVPFLIGSRSHGCQLVLGKWRWQLTGASFKGDLMSGQIFPCSLGERSEAGVGSAEAIFPFFCPSKAHVYVCGGIRLLVFCFSHPPFPHFLALRKICICFWSPYSAEVLKHVFRQGPEGTTRSGWPSPAPARGPGPQLSSAPGPPVPAPGLLHGCPVPFPAVPDSSSGSPRLTSDGWPSPPLLALPRCWGTASHRCGPWCHSHRALVGSLPAPGPRFPQSSPAPAAPQHFGFQHAPQSGCLDSLVPTEAAQKRSYRCPGVTSNDSAAALVRYP